MKRSIKSCAILPDLQYTALSRKAGMPVSRMDEMNSIDEYHELTRWIHVPACQYHELTRWYAVQCVAVCCSVLQARSTHRYAAVWCRVLQCVAACCKPVVRNVGAAFVCKMAKMRKMPYFHRLFSAKEPYNKRLFCGKRPAHKSSTNVFLFAVTVVMTPTRKLGSVIIYSLVFETRHFALLSRQEDWHAYAYICVYIHTRIFMYM